MTDRTLLIVCDGRAHAFYTIVASTIAAQTKAFSETQIKRTPHFYEPGREEKTTILDACNSCYSSYSCYSCNSAAPNEQKRRRSPFK